MPSPTLLVAEAAFATPVFTYEVPNGDALNQALIRDIETYRQVSEGMRRSNQLGWHSPTDFFRRPEASFKELAGYINIAVTAATRQISPNLDLTGRSYTMQGWVNMNGRGAYNVPHTHPNFEWSGSYYVKLPAAAPGSRSGSIEFLDPRGSVTQMDALSASCFAPKMRKAPREGTMLLFPSYLRHWVYPNEQEETRISIAFNVKLKAKQPAAGPSPA